VGLTRITKLFKNCLINENQLKISIGALVAAGLLAPVFSQAQLVFTVENAGVQATTVAGVTTENFNSQALGAFSGSSAVGTFTSGGAIVAADEFGGANGSDYYAVGAQSGQLESTLTLNGAQDYFGLWWSAGDAGNELVFLDGSTVIGDYHVGDIISKLNSSYDGNPNNGEDGGEPFAYLDFTSVEFKNASTGSGFELDNISVLDQVITPPGNSIPDGGSSILLTGMAASALMALRKKLTR
jgi:hypothetical protein